MRNHERDLVFATLELLRKIINQSNNSCKKPDFSESDWKDADDWLFSELPFTREDLDHIYYGRDVIVDTTSAINSPSPAALTYDELSPYYKTAALQCIATHSGAVVEAGDIPGKPVLLTEGDIENLADYIGFPIEMQLFPVTQSDPAEIVLWARDPDGGLQLLYTAAEIR